MPYAENQGVRIHYQVAGEGMPLVLLHGLAGSLADFIEWGYVSALRDDYQLVLIDARGHGASDKPHDAESYRMRARAADVVAVLDELNVEKAHYLGYSMGGWIGFGLLKYAPECFRSMIIGGAHPFHRRREGPHPLIAIIEQGIEAACAAYERMFIRQSPQRRARFLNNDPQALIALLSMDEMLEFEEMLPNVSLPCLLFAGDAAAEHDDARECAARMPNATFVSIPSQDHASVIRQSSLVLPPVLDFLNTL